MAEEEGSRKERERGKVMTMHDVEASVTRQCNHEKVMKAEINDQIDTMKRKNIGGKKAGSERTFPKGSRWSKCAEIIHYATDCRDMPLIELLRRTGGGTMFQADEDDDNNDSNSEDGNDSAEVDVNEKEIGIKTSHRWTTQKKRKVEKEKKSTSCGHQLISQRDTRTVLIRRNDPDEYKQMMETTMVAPDTELVQNFFLLKRDVFGNENRNINEYGLSAHSLHNSNVDGSWKVGVHKKTMAEIVQHAAEFLFSQRYVLDQ